MSAIAGVFDIFKVGIGPSSSHTLGPMLAANRFLETLFGTRARDNSKDSKLHVTCELFGSLALTGKGHATDRAVVLGLCGFRFDDVDAEAAKAAERRAIREGRVSPPGGPRLVFQPEYDLIYNVDRTLRMHPNGMIFIARDADGRSLLSETYYSVGGGFVATERQLSQDTSEQHGPPIPVPFTTAAELLAATRESGMTIAEVMRQNEEMKGGERTLSEGLARLWSVMANCIDRGLSTEGTLPGGLDLTRRAPGLHRRSQQRGRADQPARNWVGDVISAYAIAVSEENAAGGQVVTAPTNGAAGVVPAVLRYYLDHTPDAAQERIEDFLLTAAAIGGLIKHNASISGAEMGCQGEVGSAAAMAAAGLCAVLDGTPEQVENAAEIALEHHLGMTCDPIKGLVQAPCIERNAMGAIKAVSAASLALSGDGRHLVSLDACVETMRQIGRDMDVKYRETSRGGLAINVPEC